MACTSLSNFFLGDTISGQVEGANLDEIDFFLLFYVEMRTPVKITKAQMTKVADNIYNWAISSATSKTMNEGLNIGELCLKGNVSILKFNAFYMADDKSKTFLP